MSEYQLETGDKFDPFAAAEDVPRAGAHKRAAPERRGRPSMRPGGEEDLEGEAGPPARNHGHAQWGRQKRPLKTHLGEVKFFSHLLCQTSTLAFPPMLQ